jgi:hypothetical protein
MLRETPPPRCSARKYDGTVCNNFPLKGGRVCRLHGGMSPRGMRAGSWQNGAYSKYVPRLDEKIQAARSDPELMAFREDVSLLRARLQELLETGESEQLWTANQRAVGALKRAVMDGDRVGIMDGLRRLEELATRGMADSLRWGEIYQVVESMTKVKEREMKRLVAMQQMISSEELLGILGQIAHAAKQSIRNPADYREFANTIAVYSTANLSLTD